MLFQQANLVGHLSVAENVALAQRLARRGAPATRARCSSAAGSPTARHARPGQLSGGELARAGLAVALANDPPVLLADEPTGELDEATAARVLDLLRDRADAGAAVLVVTHSPEVAAGRRPRDPRCATGGWRHDRRRSCAARARRAPTAAAPAATVALQPTDCEVAPGTASRSSGRPARASRRCCT